MYCLQFDSKDSTSVSVALVPLISNISQILISYYTDKLYLLVGRYLFVK